MNPRYVFLCTIVLYVLCACSLGVTCRERAVASFIRLAARVAVEVAEGGKLARYKTALEQIALGKMASISW